MYHPTARRKPRINYSATFRRLHQLLRDPSPIAPAPRPTHLAAVRAQYGPGPKKLRFPQLKGNVWNTMKEIVTIFYATWQRARGATNLAITTTRASLAKRCGNRDPKTAYRHILTLVETGFLRAKVHIRHGLQLLLNPTLLVFEEVEQLPSPPAQAGGSTQAAAVADSVRQLAATFSLTPVQRT
ncbi:hypothetical protein K3G63_22335 [Hymenobacter sp. HSC-4F20]|uniref:hypothetical protein n=1 Tax=Hymenobacter sp. HSC-4F20 TaxID=2864135 RepID=UPI001C73682B|nr:hypothetical protein [Hymenobacter sp. HSC-4F20]MBX0293200.1 hypothetical protein [Hymenobacter sp. HSC-4F20]